MSPEKQRIAIAEVCGYEWYLGALVKKGAQDQNVPSYLSDLNAMHEAEKALPVDKLHIYAERLAEIVSELRPLTTTGKTNWWWMMKYVHATAAQRAEAFLHTLKLWTESDEGSEVHARSAPVDT